MVYHLIDKYLSRVSTCFRCQFQTIAMNFLLRIRLFILKVRKLGECIYLSIGISARALMSSLRPPKNRQS
ncbi:hypothetical protein EYC84_006611 [Monilinia fructicola]|uniref:Uncharacterized protein n=1 Tax=Monilinia fructicola TaxID=38448 RepID=A0A5M9K6F2_MONFR|nr:hypothetical protein EYC84_006611 [Monilinia fructicola]